MTADSMTGPGEATGPSRRARRSRRSLARPVALLLGLLLLALGAGAAVYVFISWLRPVADIPLKAGLRLTYKQKVGGAPVPGAPLTVGVKKVGRGADGLPETVTVDWVRKPKAQVKKAARGERLPQFAGRRTVTGLADGHVLGPDLRIGERGETRVTAFWLSRDAMDELREDGETTLTFEGQLHRVIVRQEQYDYTAVVNGRTSTLKAMWIVTRETESAKEADLIVLADQENPLVLKFDPRPYSLSGWELSDAKF